MSTRHKDNWNDKTFFCDSRYRFAWQARSAWRWIVMSIKKVFRQTCESRCRENFSKLNQHQKLLLIISLWCLILFCFNVFQSSDWKVFSFFTGKFNLLNEFKNLFTSTLIKITLKPSFSRHRSKKRNAKSRDWNVSWLETTSLCV